MGARRILLTRPRERAEPFAAALESDGWEATIWPLTTIRPVSAAISPEGVQAVLFTSRAGVEHAPETVRGLPAYCVGDATADAARKAGHSEAMSAGGAASDLLAMTKRLAAPDGGALIHVRGKDAAGDVGAGLRDAGYELREAIVYEAAAVSTAPTEIVADIRKGAFAAAAFFSPRASAIFANLAEEGWREGLSVATAFAISENAARPLRDAGFESVAVAEAPTAEALRAAICGAAV